MPESTPIYGFTYPCPDETITSTSFTTLANQIDTKLLDVNNDLVAALERRNVQPNIAGPQTIAAGVETVLTLAGMTYVIPQSGIWIVKSIVNAASTPATVNSMRARILQNAVVRLGFTHNTELNVTNSPIPAGPIVATAGDTITTSFLYDGVGTMDVNASFSAKLIVRIA